MLATQRLQLRRWRSDDRPAFAAMNADPRVMPYFLGPLERSASDAFVDRIEAGFEADGFGLWALEIQGRFAGFVGLSRPGFIPGVEIGWRLARWAWGHGYATEAARLVLDDAFSRLQLAEVISMTAVENMRSRRVMERLGMVHAEDFDHPQVPVGHWLRPHVLYRCQPG